tara:strand:+ start:972 stop:1217 length:246 start_codon:yes stop_codon:yes gene_type:complete
VKKVLDNTSKMSYNPTINTKEYTMTKLANKYTESMMKAIDETKNFEKLTEIQGLTLMYAMLKQRNYTKFHKDSKYINPNNQ